VVANREFHGLLVGGVAVETLREGEKRGELVRLVDFDEPGNNDWVAVNQFTILGETERRPDIVVLPRSSKTALPKRARRRRPMP